MDNELINSDTPPPIPANVSLPDPLIQKFLQTQHQNALIEADQIKLRGKELDHSKEMSIKFIELDARLEADKPSEDRNNNKKSVYRPGVSDGLLLFAGFCLSIGKESFLIELIKIMLYPLLTIW